MWKTTLSFFILPSLILATSQPASSSEETFIPQSLTASLTHTTSLSPGTSSVSSDFPSSTHYNDLELRQGVGAAGGVAAPPPSATQMSPITTYLVRGPDGNETPYPHTQTFAQVPEQWPAPTPGTIGLGTIQGQIGIVKTSSKQKRSLPAPTDIVRSVQKIVKRKPRSVTSANNGNAAGCIGVPVWGMMGAVVVGLGMVVLL